MIEFTAFMAEHARIGILVMLERAPQSQMNSAMLRDGLHAMLIKISADQLRTQLAWLQEQGLVQAKSSDALPGIQLVTLTERGADVATGLATVPGVRRPTSVG